MSIDRFLPRARRLPLLVPPLFPSAPALFVTPFTGPFVPLSRLFSTSLCSPRPPSPTPYLHPPRSLVPSLFVAHPLFHRFASSFSFSLFASCDRTTQPNNRHRRLKPENSVASSLLFSRSTRQSSFSILRHPIFHH